MDTQRSLYEIEIALSKTDNFNYIKNIIAFNVYGLGESLNIGHECDMLVLSKNGYLSEIEIKRSWEDFKNDFKKNHKHESYNNIIKHFYYCVPESILAKCIEYWQNNSETMISGFITYDEDLNITFHNVNNINKNYTPYRKLFIEEQLQIARFGAMRAITLKEKLINQKY